MASVSFLAIPALGGSRAHQKGGADGPTETVAALEGRRPISIFALSFCPIFCYMEYHIASAFGQTKSKKSF
ncbi:hypothetical protein A3C67_03210 [Candidatus Nomurabacteria bacterium RIFCSPHIGHO2_02_FULL_42_19]|uniref:Uncharacterized protein n=1 Tax=Candidatus Nomurabacteria bacterium RIFCSPHIGHO2_02_FULL_42_19 TaxID=1801756 RepID=A0A1F6W2N3_9BACT|nr:MAG: hypothetical protein A3C67_03210 [Candidatus Nomurabacteria bacterium RIFCSPHIGHO2_02_FULL_42_19]